MKIIKLTLTNGQVKYINSEFILYLDYKHTYTDVSVLTGNLIEVISVIESPEVILDLIG